MTSPSHHEGRPANGELQVRLFVGQRCVLGRTLVVPVRLLWRDYKAWCARRRYRADVTDLLQALERASWCELRQGGRGRFRLVADGVGLRPNDGTP